ncbi:MAG TPA: YdbH domain-containing protein, partial [Opitutus sp.]|nr:YdbH domain-containing protein [Opitutus sp.]
VEMSGGGVIDAGASRGVMRIEWKDGGVRHEADGWTLEGVSFAGEFAIDTEKGTIESTLPLSVVVQTMTTARFGARGLAVIARLNADRTLAVEEARIEIAGGEVTADPTTVALTPMASELNLRITNVGLQDVAALVPSGLLESRGRINGAVRVGWSEAGGFKLGEGNLVLEQTEPAMVRLAPTPGFLTAQITERVPLLPASFGPLARWTSLRNPAFEEIRDIELGRTGLQIESLSVQLSPQGDRDGRTARVRMTGRPARPDSVVGAVTFEVNVAGPLSEVLRLGMNQSFSVETR